MMEKMLVQWREELSEELTCDMAETYHVLDWRAFIRF